MRKFGQPTEIAHQRQAAFQLQERDDRGEVAVPDPLAVAVHRPLHLHGAGLHGRQGVGHAQPAVIVGMGADRTADGGHRGPRRLGHKLRQASAIRVAQHDDLGPRTGGGPDGFQRILRILPVAVEEVLGIVKNPPSLRFEKCHGVAIIAKFSSSVTPKTSVTCSGHVLPTTVTTGVCASSSWRTCASSSTFTPPRRVMPKAAIWAFFHRRLAASVKKAASFGFDPGHPPSM